MPAFDPVRDAVLNSPIGQTAPMLPLPSPSSTLSSPMASPSLGRRATDLSVLLNSHSQEPSLRTPPPLRSSTLSHLLHSDDYEDKLDTSQPLTRSSVESIPVSRKSKSMFSSSPSPTRESPVSRSRPSSSSSSVSISFPNQFNNPVSRPAHSNQMPPPPPPQPATIPYNPKVRITPPTSVLIPLSPAELEAYKDYRYQGRGSAQLANVGKRKRSTSPRGGDSDQPPAKRLHGDVGVVVEHYNSRPDVGVVQRLDSPIIGLKNFNNWVKSVLITRFAHPVLAASRSKSMNGNHNYRGGRGREGNTGAGKVLDMGCGKGGDMTKWAKAKVRELIGVDIAAVSVDQARSRWESLRGPKYAASFAALDCYTQPLSRAFGSDKLGIDSAYDYNNDSQLSGEPFDVVSMQFCMHYAFETVEKARCMLDNVSRYLRRGGIFIGTIPNAELLLEHLDALPPNSTDLSFGNSVYKITFDEREEKPLFGHKYWFFLRDAVENVPEYVVHWDNFVQMAAEYDLVPIYKEEFHQVFDEHQEHPEFGPLMVRMKVVDANGESAMDEDQWEAANIYIAFAFEKR